MCDANDRKELWEAVDAARQIVHLWDALVESNGEPERFCRVLADTTFGRRSIINRLRVIALENER